MSATTEQLEERLQVLVDELDEWAAGKRSWCNMYANTGDPATQAQVDAGVATRDAAHVNMLVAQMTATVALLQLVSSTPASDMFCCRHCMEPGECEHCMGDL